MTVSIPRHTGPDYCRHPLAVVVGVRVGLAGVDTARIGVAEAHVAPSCATGCCSARACSTGRRRNRARSAYLVAVGSIAVAKTSRAAIDRRRRAEARDRRTRHALVTGCSDVLQARAAAVIESPRSISLTPMRVLPAQRTGRRIVRRALAQAGSGQDQDCTAQASSWSPRSCGSSWYRSLAATIAPGIRRRQRIMATFRSI